MILNTNIFTILLVLTCTFSYAQRRSSITGRKKFKSHNRGAHQKPINYINNLKGTAFLGTSKYVGDVAGRAEAWNKSNLSIGFGAQYRFNEHISFRGDLNLIRLAGDDKFSSNKNRNLSFNTNIYEIKCLWRL